MRKTIIILFILLTGCTVNYADAEDNFVGSWISEVQESEWGEVKFRIIISADNLYVFDNLFVEKNKSIKHKGKYIQSDKNEIQINDINKDDPLVFTLSGQNLLLTMGGEVINFQREL